MYRKVGRQEGTQSLGQVAKPSPRRGQAVPAHARAFAHGPLTTPQLVKHLAGRDNALVYVLHEDATESIKDVPLTVDAAETTELILLIGPEGGIGDEELATLQAAGAQAIKLGPEVLRTASAAMVALAAIGVRTSRW